MDQKRKKARQNAGNAQHASLARSDFLQPLNTDLTRNTPSTYLTRESLMCACTHVTRNSPAHGLPLPGNGRELGRASEPGALSTDLPNSSQRTTEHVPKHPPEHSHSSGRRLSIRMVSTRCTTRARVETLKSSCSLPLYWVSQPPPFPTTPMRPTGIRRTGTDSNTSTVGLSLSIRVTCIESACFCARNECVGTCKWLAILGQSRVAQDP